MAAAPASESVSLKGVHHHPGQGRLINVHDPPKLRWHSGFGDDPPEGLQGDGGGLGAAAHAGVVI